LKARNGLLLVAALFLVGFIHNAVTGEAHPGDTVLQWLAIVLASAAFWFLRHEERLRDELLTFLVANKSAIQAGTAVYRGHTLSYATRLRNCEVVISFLVASFRLRIQRLVDDRGDRGLRLGANAVTFVFGWWGLPWGPIWTVRTLVTNLRHTTDTTVGEVLEGTSTVTLPPATTR